MTTAPPTRVVLLGGGYATMHAYRALARRVGREAITMTVVSADDSHNFHGFTGEVVAGLLPLAVTRTPLVEVLPRADFLHGQVIRVDLAQRLVIAQPVAGGEPRQLPFDQLIVATGGREPVEQVPGMREHGFTLRGPGELERFLERLSRIAAPGSADRHARESRDSAPVVIAGGGMAGVELAAAVADRLRAAGVDNPVLLVHSGAEILPGLRAELPSVAARAERELARLGVQVRTGLSIIAVDDAGVELSDGTHLSAAAVLGTIGQRPVALPGLESLPHDGAGRLVTDSTLLVVPGVWAAGDTARVTHARSGKPVPANALWAIKAGGVLGHNISRVITGRRPQPFRYRGLGLAMAFGLGRSATEMYGIGIPGFTGWLLRLGFFLRFMPQRRRAVAVLAAFALLPLRGRHVPAPDPLARPSVVPAG